MTHGPHSLLALGTLLLPLAFGGHGTAPDPTAPVGCVITLKFNFNPAGVLAAAWTDQDRVEVIFRAKKSFRDWPWNIVQASQVRLRSGWWSELESGSAKFKNTKWAVVPGQSYQDVYELRQGCNNRRRYRFHFTLIRYTSAEKERIEQSKTHMHYFPASDDWTKKNHNVVTLGNVARFFR